jgi:probable F420-dependent oxidoreductase
MQFGVSLPNFSGLGTRDAIVEIAQEAEALGYDSIWTTDHVMMQKGHTTPYGHILEAFTTLTYVAALTKRVRLGTSVIVFPPRNPVLLAKEAATLDQLSGGRLILGVGAGWNETEFGFMGASFHDRGRRLDEYIRVLRELWTAPDPRFEGEYVRFADVEFSPRPVQPAGPPIWVGGSSPAALRRTARLGDGWHPVGITPDRFAEGLGRLRELANGRELASSLRLNTVFDRTLPEVRSASGQIQVALSGSADEIVTRVKEYRAVGCEHLVLQFDANDLETNLTAMRRFAAEVRVAIQ